MRSPGKMLEAFGLLAIMAMGTAIRWLGIRRGLWIDELTTSWVIRDAWSDIPSRALLNNLGPLFYGATWITTRLAGYDEIGLRLLSCVAGILVIPAIYLVARNLAGSRTAALVAAFLVATDDIFVHYSLEARPYSLVQLFALVNIALFMFYDRYRTPTLAILMGLNAALLFHLHYTTVLFTGVNALILLIQWIRGQTPSRNEAAGLAAGLALFAIAILPTIPQLNYLISQKDALASFIEPAALEESVSRFHLLRYVVLPLAFAVVIGYALRAERPEQSPPRPSCLTMILLWFFVPPIVAWVLQRASLININLDRYMIACSVACVLLSVLTIRYACTGRVRSWTFTILILGALYWAHGTLKLVGMPWGQQYWKNLVAQVNDSGLSNLPVYINPGLVEAHLLSKRRDSLFRDYLLSPVNSAYRLRADLLRNAQPVVDPGSIREVNDTTDFLFIGYLSALDSLRQVAAGMAERSNETYDIRFLSGGASTPWDLMAVHVTFQGGR